MRQYYLLFLFFIFHLVQSQNTAINSTESNDKTFRVFKILEIKCNNTEQCSTYLENFVCKENICQCADSFTLSSDGSECKKTPKGYGAHCDDSTQCFQALSAGGTCINNQCQCKEGFHYLKGYCWKNRGLKETCVQDEQCYSTYENRGLRCYNNLCLCKEEYYERLESGCRRKRFDHESCNIDLDCPNGTTCERMKCYSNAVPMDPPSNTTLLRASPKALNGTCPPGNFEMGGSCILELGMECKTDQDCNHISKASCIENICTCELVTYVPKENKRECLPVARAKIEDLAKSTCKENVQCSVFGPHSFCNETRCHCAEGSYFDIEHQFCWPARKLGEECLTDTDCGSTQIHAQCNATSESPGVCHCRKGFHQAGDVCLTDAWNVGDFCEADESCLFPNSFCNSTTRTCRCLPHFYEEEKKCKVGVGGPCSEKEHCNHIMHSFCDISNKTCQCKDSHVSDLAYKTCIKAAKFNEKCNETAQCQFYLGEYGGCVKGMCWCVEKSHYINETCHSSKDIGEKCVRRWECFPGADPNSVLCFKGVCTCNFDYTLNDDLTCVPSKSVPISKIHPLLLIISFLTHFKLFKGHNSD